MPIPKRARKQKKKVRKAVVYGDRHGIFADPRAEEVLFAVIEDVQPDTIVNLGDDVDCYVISGFDKDKSRLVTLQDEVDNTRAHLHKVSQLAPDAEKWWLEGNHEDRLRRIIWGLPGAAVELTKLKVFQKHMTWPGLVDTASIGWNFVAQPEQSKTSIIPKLITKHGDRVAAYSGMSAKAEWMRYGKSGISGHTHRLGQFLHRDLNGSHVWQENGCLCRFDMEYVSDPDWQQGFSVVSYGDDWFTIEPIYIEKGRARFRDVDYRA